MGGEDKGKEFLTKLKANGLKIFKTSGPSLAAITTGDQVFAVVQDAGYYGAKFRGDPLGIVYPSSGLGTLPSVIGISAKGKHQACAKEFVN